MLLAATFGTLNYVILLVYLGAMFTIGLALAGRQKTTQVYFLAGQRMPWFIVAMSMFASLTSAISYTGVPVPSQSLVCLKACANRGQTPVILEYSDSNLSSRSRCGSQNAHL